MNEHESFHELGQFHGETATQSTGVSNIGDSSFPFLDMGTSFVIGLAIGYFLKKSFKFLLLILGLGLVLLFVLESQGMFHVDDHAIQNGVSSGVSSFQNIVAMLKERLSHMELTTGAGAIAGFFAGLKFG
ncbi:hypothetical protein MNB_SV-14-405 [hydrothermal vent metagenome]|uniref:FUN14 family protein n=1 Tax=hydrothermal vent metagenome TaxID=652676 RepID=A0A1W1CD96_9ZZZZ